MSQAGFAIYSPGTLHPQIGDIDRLAVVVDKVERSGSAIPVSWDNIQNMAAAQLKEAGFTVADSNAGNTKTHRLISHVTLLEIDPNERFVFCCQTNVERLMCVPGYSDYVQEAAVWESATSLAASVAKDVNETISKTVASQVDSFIKARLAQAIKATEKQPGQKPADRFETPDQTKALNAASQVGKPEYVATKTSQVFHKSDCPMAARIAEKNKIAFTTRVEASQGRRPCKVCKP